MRNKGRRSASGKLVVGLKATRKQRNVGNLARSKHQQKTNKRSPSRAVKRVGRYQRSK